ncbi:MAG: filamentous hemagglutinin N-terminal domain-containing protein, partial [Xanthobacteraceae bacterium]
MSVRGRSRGSSPALYGGLATAIVVLALIPQGPASAQHLPTGGTVTTGTATIVQPNGTTLNINQSTNQAIINWNTFSVGRGDTVNFNQPSAASSTLNRVLGSTPSWIAGTINAPGTVLLINPNGIEITKSGVVNTGSFAASTLNITDSDYLSGLYKFTGNGGSAGVINNGRINTADGGFAALLGGQVSNNGIISARLGFVALGAGEEATLDLSGDGFLSVGVPSTELGKLVNANGALVRNRGKIIADGGTVFLSAATAANILRNAVNIPGSIRTNSVGVHNGRIVINGGGGTVTVTGKLAANGNKKKSGGSIAIAGNDINVSGTLSANGGSGGTISLIGGSALTLAGTLMAQGYRGEGGEIDLTANNVTLTGATVNASGTTAGGLVVIGGDFQGGNGDPTSALYQEFLGRFTIVPDLAPAHTVSVDAASTINVSATNSGNGGTAIVWSQQETDFAGSIIGTGGPNGGNGGYAEVSGANLNFTGTVNLLAASGGTIGTLLLDPDNVTITTSTSNDSCVGSNPATCSPTGSGANLNVSTLTGELASSNVVVDTGSSGSQNGTITVSSPISWTAATTLTLAAANKITISAGITDTSGSLVLTSSGSGSSGNISVGAGISVNSLTISTAGTVSQSASISTPSLLLEGGGTYKLTNTSNSIGTLAANDSTGTVSLYDGSNLAIGTVNLIAGVT